MTREFVFEDAMRDLEKIVTELEDGKFSLEEAIKAFEKGTELKKICENKLKEAQLKVEKIVSINDGEVDKVEIKR